MYNILYLPNIYKKIEFKVMTSGRKNEAKESESDLKPVVVKQTGEFNYNYKYKW